LKGIIGLSNVLTMTLLEKNPATRTLSSPTLRIPCGTIAGTTAIWPGESRLSSSPKVTSTFLWRIRSISSALSV
jgi:hypothetical protein